MIARADDDPRPEMIMGSAVFAAFVGIAFGWAALAPLGSAAGAPGEIKVSGDRQSVQTLAGGVVSALYAREGETVAAGALLVGFASAEAVAEERALATRVIDVQAEIARLEADQQGAAAVAPPPDFALLSARDAAEAANAIAREQHNLDKLRATRAARQGVFRTQIGEVGAQIQGYRMRHDSVTTQRALSQQELTMVETLAARGYVPRTRVLALQRSAAALGGDSGSLTAEIARLQQNAAETKLQMTADRGAQAQATADRLREARAELQTLLPQWRSARGQLARTEVRAPVAGSIVGLAVHTIGGVVRPGETLMDVVPANRSLTIQARIAPGDVNQLKLGQEAHVRVPSIHDRSVPSIVGHVTRISADSLTDERTGRAYYTASVFVGAGAFDRFARSAGLAARLKPGTPVDVQIPLRARSALQFWLEPFTQILAHAGAER